MRNTFIVFVSFLKLKKKKISGQLVHHYKFDTLFSHHYIIIMSPKVLDLKNTIIYILNGLSIISSYPQCKDGNVWFSLQGGSLKMLLTVPLKQIWIINFSVHSSSILAKSVHSTIYYGWSVSTTSFSNSLQETIFIILLFSRAGMHIFMKIFFSSFENHCFFLENKKCRSSFAELGKIKIFR